MTKSRGICLGILYFSIGQRIGQFADIWAEQIMDNHREHKQL